MLRPIFTFFSFLICVIRFYGNSQFHKQYITSCYWFSVFHIILSSTFTLNILWILFFICLTYYWCGYLFSIYLGLSITQNDFEIFLKHAYLTALWFLSGLKHTAVLHWEEMVSLCIYYIPNNAGFTVSQNAAWFKLLSTSHSGFRLL